MSLAIVLILHLENIYFNTDHEDEKKKRNLGTDYSEYIFCTII